MFESRDYLSKQIVKRLTKDRQSRAIYTEMPGWVLEGLGPVIANDVPTKTAEREKPAKRSILLLDSIKEPVTSRPYVGRRSCHRIDSSQGEVWIDSLKSQVSRACAHGPQVKLESNLRRTECSLVTWHVGAYCVGRSVHGARVIAAQNRKPPAKPKSTAVGHTSVNQSCIL